MAVDAQAEHAAAAAEPDFNLAVGLPPPVAVLAAGRGAQPEPENPDRYPYIIATGTHCLLAHFSAAPFYGTQLSSDPPSSHLVLDTSLEWEPHLLFHLLPKDRALAEETPHIHSKRCVAASRNKLRYVEIITEGEAARVTMWSRSRVEKGWQWEQRYTRSFEKIWDDNSYKETRLPRNVPVLAVVCPSDPDLVYFALEQHIFGVNTRAHTVVHNEAGG
ncbi:hypothetical protein BAE44_0024115 [Dichanthelium oligosanthes]|uniref:DUF1618 domain-containing protein n=1 Tax=Dichanthelium oligosanthes TaxID=888268 RepID=A0A1E5UPS7_9POAL|nr:hypothetical protein BAE44_0024115 [Dichanthelium oligosanthes]